MEDVDELWKMSLLEMEMLASFSEHRFRGNLFNRTLKRFTFFWTQYCCDDAEKNGTGLEIRRVKSLSTLFYAKELNFDSRFNSLCERKQGMLTPT